MKTLRIGLIGAGANTQSKHIPGLLALPGVRLTRVANRSRESSEAVAREFGVEAVSSSPEKLLRDPEVDAVVIGTWPYRHAVYAKGALAAGKHVLTEARMAMNFAEAKSMLAAARKHPRLTAMVVPAPFTLSYDHEISRLIKEELGPILLVELDVTSGAFPDSKAPLTWRHQKALSGLNTMTMGIYIETLYRWFGPAASVVAHTQIVQPQRTQSGGAMGKCDVPDLVLAQGQFHRDQTSYRLLLSDVLGQAPRNRCVIHGRLATLRIPFDGTLHLRRKGEAMENPVTYTPDPAWRVEAEFVGAIRGEEKVTHTSFADGAAYMAFTEAVHRSGAKGKPVSLPKKF